GPKLEDTPSSALKEGGPTTEEKSTEKVHQEKVQQEKLNAVKARLKFEESLRHSESGTPSRRRDLKERLGPRHACSRSESPKPRRVHSKSPKERGSERKMVFKRLEKGVFHRLGDKEKRSSRSKGTELTSKKHRNKRVPSRNTKALTESEGSAGGHWKSRPKRQKSSVEDDLSRPWERLQPLIMNKRSHFRHGNNKKPDKSKTSRRESSRTNKGWSEQDRFTLLTKTPKEILALDKRKFKPLSPMTTLVEKKNASKFCELHGEVGHTMNKDNKKEGNLRKGQVAGNINGTTMAEDGKTKNYSNVLSRVSNFFPPLGEEDGTEGPMIIEAEKWEGTACTAYDPSNHATIWVQWKDNMAVRANIVAGKDRRPRVRKIRAVPSTAHEMLKFPVTGGTVSLQSSIPLECTMVSGPEIPQPVIDQVREEKIQVAIHPEYLKQTIMIADMTGVPRHIAENRLNICEGCLPVRQKKRVQSPERNKAIYEEVEKLVDADIIKEVHYDSWLSNPVMVKKHDGSWRMCVDFKDLNKACLKDGYPLPEIDWKGRHLLGVKSGRGRTKSMSGQSRSGPQSTISKVFEGRAKTKWETERPEDDTSDTPMEDVEELSDPWILFTDRSSCIDDLGAGLIITNPKGMEFTYALSAQRGEQKKQNSINQFRPPKQANTCGRTQGKSIDKKEVLAVVEEEGHTWMTPVYEYLTEGIIPEEKRKARAIHRKAGSMHSGPRSVVAKALRSGYYWPTMHTDARNLIKECSGCQVHRPVPRNPQEKLTPITSTWPFYKWGIDITGPFLEGPEKVKFLIVAMDYFTKWIEAKLVATITGAQVKKFVWDNIVCRFGLPGEIVSENEKQFRDNLFKDRCEKLSIHQCLASVKHSQANGIVERANRSLGKGIKARLEEVSHVLWAHHTMIKSSNGETPFSLTYEAEAVIPVEIGMPTLRTAEVDMIKNTEALEINLDLLEEKREQAAIQEERSKAKIERYYNARVRSTSFRPRDLVYLNNEASHVEDGGKLGPKWKGPYEVMEALGKGAYKLRDRNGNTLPRTWNVYSRKKCYVHET
nr:reverse transcriptase domain-containing protein [Tanacetum cinerariifolium]